MKLLFLTFIDYTKLFFLNIHGVQSYLLLTFKEYKVTFNNTGLQNYFIV